jgi:superfamily I DNA/RNA helicase
VNEGVLPNDMMASGEEDELNVSTERRLLYTAMTRAEKELYLFSSSSPSPFIAEMNAALFQTR